LQYYNQRDLESPMMSTNMTTSPLSHLALMRKGQSATVTGLAEAVDSEQLTIKIRLMELGFAVGEKIRVVAESFPRRDPMAVRVGNTTFALRRAEAAMIQVSTDLS
jgi:ferrous iron transport protein A